MRRPIFLWEGDQLTIPTAGLRTLFETDFDVLLIGDGSGSGVCTLGAGWACHVIDEQNVCRRLLSAGPVGVTCSLQSSQPMWTAFDTTTQLSDQNSVKQSTALSREFSFSPIVKRLLLWELPGWQGLVTWVTRTYYGQV